MSRLRYLSCHRVQRTKTEIKGKGRRDSSEDFSRHDRRDVLPKGGYGKLGSEMVSPPC